MTEKVSSAENGNAHRMGTAEFESAILVRDQVAEAAVVGFPHPKKGQGAYTFIVLQPGVEVGESFLKVVNTTLREQTGAHARLDGLQIIPGLPRARSGKVMRRIMRKVVEGRSDELADVSTLADPPSLRFGALAMLACVVDAIVGEGGTLRRNPERQRTAARTIC